MYKILSIGTSFNHGMGLHFYNRHVFNQKLSNEDINVEEREFCKEYAFHTLIANKLGVKSEIFFGQNLGLSTAFDNMIENLKNQVNTKTDIPIKIIIWQLSNIEKDFFIYNDKIYRLKFDDYNSVIKSKNEILANLDESIDKEDFSQKLEEDIKLWCENVAGWREKHVPWFINKVNELNKFLVEKDIILKVVSYYSDYSPFRRFFDKNIFVNLEVDNKQYSHIHGMAWTEKLMLCHDLPTHDQHPNFKAHEIVADSIYKSILKHPLYSTI